MATLYTNSWKPSTTTSTNLHHWYRMIHGNHSQIMTTKTQVYMCILPRSRRRSGCGGGMLRLTACSSPVGARLTSKESLQLIKIAPRFTFAIIISVYNKWMFSPSHLGFPYPLLVTTLHMLVQFGMSATIRAVWPERFKPKGTPRRADYGYVSPPA